MRIGYNPHKDQIIEPTTYLHHVVMPIYIPHQKDYFKDGLNILKLALESLFKTTHNKTFFTLVNNGSCKAVKDYLDSLQLKGAVHEVIHTTNIGKLNAILKGLAGHDIELVTITDADVLFKNNWQQETIKVFNAFPKVGVVGIVPQFNMFKAHCGNTIFDNFFNKKLKFLPVKSPEDMALFYKSIGWDNTYNKDLLQYSLGIEHKEMNVLLGSGHFVATYKKQQFKEITSYLGYKLGGDSESYLDKAALSYDYWRVTTQNNYAYHMGNVIENWMIDYKIIKEKDSGVYSDFSNKKKIGGFSYIIKNKIFYKLILNKWFSNFFYRWKGLPKTMVTNYNSLKAK